ncbi:transcription antitermination factor NusB [Rickettsiales bacterium LUAb2]
MEENIQKNNKLPGVSSKELTRLVALDILYAMQFNEQDTETTIDQFLANETWKLNFADIEEEIYIAKLDEDFLKFLVNGVVLTNDKITEYIKSLLTNNKYDYSSLLLKLILALAIFELKEVKALSHKIIISQYIFIASLFFDDIQIAFINAVLDQAGNNLSQK